MNPNDAAPVLLGVEDAGRTLYSARPTPGARAWAVLVLLVLGGGLLVYALAPDRSPLLFGLGALGTGVVLGALFASGPLDHHRVCEHALVLGPSPWPGGEGYVIPWSTVPPESVTLHAPLNRPGRAGAEMGSRGARAAVYSTKGVSVVGLHADLAHPRRRLHSRSAHELLRGRTPADLEQNPPRTRWVMGVRDPEPLLRAIEQAMTQHHHDAVGIADRALANPMSGGHPVDDR
jgi:hypothetical protein